MFSNDPAWHLLQVVLVNGGTASTSELLAGALHDSAGVQLVGEKTFGKGVTQRVVPLSDGSVLLVSTASYMTPKHIPVHKVKPPASVSSHPRLHCMWLEWMWEMLDVMVRCRHFMSCCFILP